MGRERWIVVAVCIAVVAAGCSRSGDSSKADDSGSTTTSPARQASGDFGSLADVCQPGDATGATAQGVTDDEIRIATFSDAGFSGRPGLNQELFDTAAVFSQWCNEAGGINGRKIVVDERDAALTNYKPKILESCQQDFFMVGGGAVFDDTGVPDRLKCLLPDVAAYVVTPEARGADLLVQPLPNPIDRAFLGEYRWLGKKYPASTEHVGILTGNLPTTVTVARQAQEAVESLGWKVVYNDQYPAAGPTDWSPYVQGMKDKGVEGLVWIGEPENLAKLQQGMADANFSVDWIRTDVNHYDERLIDVGGAAVKNTFMPSSFAPFEDAANNPATQRYLDLFARYKPDAKTKAALGVQAWSAWLLFAQAASDCGSDLTRKCVYDGAKEIHDWTGGGLHAPTDPGKNQGSRCFVMLKADGDGFHTVDVGATDGIYSCSDKNGYQLQGNFGKGVTLADVGKSIDDLK
jgi:ABC-type branched-subunit amino acid transport system substrate-binding protein